MVENFDVVIIGAGITGLTTTYELAKKRIKVKQLEQLPRVGGAINSDLVNGYLLEYGPNSFQESDEINLLVNELNLTQDFVTADPKMPRYIYFQGKLQPVPLSPPAMIFSNLLSLSGKLRILVEPLISKRKDNTEESIADFVRRRLGVQVHDRLVSPFVSGIYAGNTENLSLAASFPTLAELESNYGSLILGAIKSRNSSPQTTEKKVAKRLCSFKNGLSSLPTALANYLKDYLELDCKILDLSINNVNPQYKIKFQQNNVVREIQTNHLVLATPAHSSAKLLSNYFPQLANELQTIEYVPMVIVHLSLSLSDLSDSLDGFGFLIPRSEQVRTLGCIWNSSLFPNRAPKGQALLTNFIGGAHDPKAYELPEKELAQIVGQELKTILNIKATPSLVSVYKHQKAIPQYSLEHLKRLEVIETEIKNQPGLYLTGNYLKGISIPDCVSRGKSLAARIGEII